MYRAQVLTWWTAERTPHVFGMLAEGDSGMDVTGQATTIITPAPNAVIVEIWCGDAMLDAIEAHPDYGPGAILWSEKDVATDKMDTQSENDFAKLSAALERRGAKCIQIIAWIGASVAARTRVAICNVLRARLKELPKKNDGISEVIK